MSSRKTSSSKPTGSKRKALRGPKKDRSKLEVTDQAIALSDTEVAEALADVLPTKLMTPAHVFVVMQKFKQPLLKALIPGKSGRLPTNGMLQAAKKKVLTFLKREEAKEAKESTSDLVRAFQLASGEVSLRFDWSFAKQRVKKASFDRQRKVDKWDECLAMTSGDTNATSEIFICGTKFMTQRALTSVLCHEALHNLARRHGRPGNPFLAEDTEHIAMALLGDPQLVHEPSLIECGLAPMGK